VEVDGHHLPALAQATEQEGATTARNLVAEIRGVDLAPFRYHYLG
jgi:NADH dehydrogenase FAD-containing subunit